MLGACCLNSTFLVDEKGEMLIQNDIVNNWSYEGF